PALLVLRSTVEGAELARGHADVGVVDIPVDDVRDNVVRVPATAYRVGRLAQCVERRLGVEQQRLLRTDPAAVGGPVEDVVKLPGLGHASERTDPRPSPGRIPAPDELAPNIMPGLLSSWRRYRAQHASWRIG